MPIRSLGQRVAPASPQISVSIVGVGVVGSAVKQWFEGSGYPVHVYDPDKGLFDRRALDDAEIVFVCVPTPYGRLGFDGSAVEAAVDAIQGAKTVVIKSTVIPGTTDMLQERYPQHKLIFSPEFLREKTAYSDFVFPSRQILGVTRKSVSCAATLINLLPPATYTRVVPCQEAELIKHATNAFLAVKVIFANEIYDLCAVLNLNYSRVREGIAADQRIGPSHLDVFADGYQGFGGSCLPKDVGSLLDFAGDQGVRMRLLETVKAVNEELLHGAGIATADGAGSHSAET